MFVVPLRAVPAQVLTINLANQSCRIVVQQKATGLFVDLYVNDALIIGGVIGRNADRMVRDAYLGFIGDLAWLDTQGADDPEASGLGTRWQLLYLEVADQA